MRRRPLMIGLAALWILFGAGLFYEAVLNTIKWRTDPIYGKVGLSWDSIGMTAGAAALVLGIWLILNVRVGRWLAYLIAGLFVLYTTAYLIFGGEGALIIRIALPLAVLALSAITIWKIGKERNGQRT
jgi:hypothetical protein